MTNEELLLAIREAAINNQRELKLINCQLTSLPPEIGSLTDLLSLDLRHNQLTSLPPEIGSLTRLKSLRLSNNRLTSFPPEIGSLTNLKSLDLSTNQLTSLPLEIIFLTKLTHLCIDRNRLDIFLPEICELIDLIRLDICRNQLRSLRSEIGQLSHLKSLNLARNNLKELPRQIGELTNLTRLDLRLNQLTSLPREIGNLIHLQSLDITENNLTYLPPEIGNLIHLQSLDISRNDLTKIPPEIGNLRHLTSLVSNKNNLTNLPTEIGKLRHLKSLVIEGNNLIVPPEIRNLWLLQSLVIKGNNLIVPLEISELDRLKSLIIKGNDLNMQSEFKLLRTLRLYLVENSRLRELRERSEQQITVYHQKWLKIAERATECDRDETAKAIKDIYQLIGREEPDILFFKSYCQAIGELGSELENKPPGNEFLLQPSKLLYIWLQKSLIFSRLMSHMWLEHEQKFQGIRANPKMNTQLDIQLWELRIKFGGRQYDSLLTKAILPIFWVEGASLFDFCHSVLNCQPTKEWDIYQALAKQPVWISPYENFCVVCDRPRILRFDNEIHAEGEPAIQFADGFSIYVYRGVRLPEEYGKLHPSQWRADWLFLEKNPDVRRALIQGIGYTRICQQWQAVQLDSWKKCTLLKINVKGEEPRICLLITIGKKNELMEFIEVPPNVRTVAEALRYLHW